MQPNIIDRIIYTQILTRAGYKVQGITQLRPMRGGTAVCGVFKDGDKVVEEIVIDCTGDTITIDEQPNVVTMRDDGSFELFIAHSDGD